jgi:hypothetical protein
MQTNTSLTIYDGSTINQIYWWVEPDKADAPGTSVHSSCGMQLLKGLVLSAIRH